MLGLFTELRGHQLLEVGWTKFTASDCRSHPRSPHSLKAQRLQPALRQEPGISR
jgi:hypothetical protein